MFDQLQSTSAEQNKPISFERSSKAQGQKMSRIFLLVAAMVMVLSQVLEESLSIEIQSS